MFPYAVDILVTVHNNMSAVLVNSFSLISTSIQLLFESMILLKRDTDNECLKKVQYLITYSCTGNLAC